jgi:hypothetical protein
VAWSSRTRTTVPSRIRRMIDCSANERAFPASQSPFTSRQTRLTISLLIISLLIAPPRGLAAPDAYWSRQDRRWRSANRRAWFAAGKRAAVTDSPRLAGQLPGGATHVAFAHLRT